MKNGSLKTSRKVGPLRSFTLAVPSMPRHTQMALVPQRDKECWPIIISAHNSVLTQTMLGEFYRSKNINMNTRTFPSEHCTVTNIINHIAMWIQALHKHFLWYVELNDYKLKEYLPPRTKSEKEAISLVTEANCIAVLLKYVLLSINNTKQNVHKLHTWNIQPGAHIF